MNFIKIIHGDALEKLKELPSKSIHCCVTSPPYFKLRDYKIKGQIGQELLPSEFINSLVLVFNEVYKVLRDDGTLWINIGDTWDKSGELIGIPWLLAFALKSKGWKLRSENIWYKLNGMPESVKTRPTYCHEQIFLFVKSNEYYYDNESVKEKALKISGTPYSFAGNKRAGANGRLPSGNEKSDGAPWIGTGLKNMRDVWPMTFEPYPGPHYATFPRELVYRAVSAGTSGRGCCFKCNTSYIRNLETIVAAGHVDRPGLDKRMKMSTDPGGVSQKIFKGWISQCKCDAEIKPSIVLDPFFGAGTTGLVSGELKRDCIGIELNKESCVIAKDRINKKGGFFFKAHVI